MTKESGSKEVKETHTWENRKGNPHPKKADAAPMRKKRDTGIENLNRQLNEIRQFYREGKKTQAFSIVCALADGALGKEEIPQYWWETPLGRLIQFNCRKIEKTYHIKYQYKQERTEVVSVVLSWLLDGRIMETAGDDDLCKWISNRISYDGLPGSNDIAQAYGLFRIRPQEKGRKLYGVLEKDQEVSEDGDLLFVGDLEGNHVVVAAFPEPEDGIRERPDADKAARIAGAVVDSLKILLALQSEGRVNAADAASFGVYCMDYCHYGRVGSAGYGNIGDIWKLLRCGRRRFLRVLEGKLKEVPGLTEEERARILARLKEDWSGESGIKSIIRYAVAVYGEGIR